jgi:predicted glycosyltransferase
MNILFDIAHPADVHFYKNARKKLIQLGHKVIFMARDKDVVIQLLEEYKIPYEKGSTARKGFFRLSGELIHWYLNAFRLIRKHKIDIAVSLSSPSTAWAAMVNGIPHLMFDDTETALTQMRMARPATKWIFTPKCINDYWGPKHIKYSSIHDMAYLRPKYFTPERCPQLDEKYAIIRFVSWDAAHDWGAEKTAAEYQKKIFRILAEKMTVYITAEGELPEELAPFRLPVKPSRLHDAIAYAQIVAGDGATTATEAAVLGVPSLYISPFSNQLGYCSFLKKYNLLYTASTPEKGISELKYILRNLKLTRAKVRKNRKKLLNDTIDLTEYIVRQILSR